MLAAIASADRRASTNQEQLTMPQNRRQFLRSAAIALAATQLGFPRLARAAPFSTPIQHKEKRMTTVTATTDTTIAPFRVNMPEAHSST
jgi:hypothetical protein